MRKDKELSEFDTLDATEKTATEGALNRCRALVDKVASELGEKKSGDFASMLIAGGLSSVTGARRRGPRTESRQSAKKIEPPRGAARPVVIVWRGMPEPTRATRLSW